MVLEKTTWNIAETSLKQLNIKRELMAIFALLKLQYFAHVVR